MIGNIRAFVLGIIDGWQQPGDLGVTYNVEHLHHENDPWLWQDHGINVGQCIARMVAR